MTFLAPEVIGDLHGEAPRGARRSVDEDGLAGLEARALLKRRPRRHAGIGDRRSRHIVKLVGQSKAARRRRDGAFGHAAIGRARHAKIDPAPVIEPAHPVDTRHKGELTG